MLRVSSLVAIALCAFTASTFSFPVAKKAPRVECVAGCGGADDRIAAGARLVQPFGVAFDKSGNWYICEYQGQRISRIDIQGFIKPFVGAGSKSGASGATGAGDVSFHDPHGIVISRGQMYVADTLNHRVIKVDLATGQAAPLAGTGQAGYSGDGGPAIKATFNQLYAVDIDRAGENLYLTDLRNRRIRLLSLKSGIVRTIAGNGQEGVPADGALALESPLVDPRAAVVDSKGNLYVLERRGNALRVVDRNGRIRTVIGPGVARHSQNTPGAVSDMNGPKHLCVDRYDNVLIVDTENHRILKYNPKTGSCVLIAGTGEKGDKLVSNDPTRTGLNRPHGVFVHPSGALYISDSENNRVLKFPACKPYLWCHPVRVIGGDAT